MSVFDGSHDARRRSVEGFPRISKPEPTRIPAIALAPGILAGILIPVVVILSNFPS